MPTFVALCHSSKMIKNKCDNSMWRMKFKQHNIPINDANTHYNDWLRDYRIHQTYENAKHYIKTNMTYDYGKNTIYLIKPLDTNHLIKLMTDNGAKKFNIELDEYVELRKTIQSLDYFSSIPFHNIRKQNLYNIDVYIFYISNRQHRYYEKTAFIGPYQLSMPQFTNLIYQLYQQHYLDDRWM